MPEKGCYVDVGQVVFFDVLPRLNLLFVQNEALKAVVFPTVDLHEHVVKEAGYAVDEDEDVHKRQGKAFVHGSLVKELPDVAAGYDKKQQIREGHQRPLDLHPNDLPGAQFILNAVYVVA